MDREAFQDAALRYGLLFAISVVLVAGFWFHGEFYQLGLVPLLIIGGGVTFLVLLSLRALGQGRMWRPRPRGTLSFSREAAERVLAGTQTVTILPIETTAPLAGSTARAVLTATTEPVAALRVRDVRRRLAGDVQDDEASAAGFDGFEGFREAWSHGRRWDPRALVVLVQFRREAKR